MTTSALLAATNAASRFCGRDHDVCGHDDCRKVLVCSGSHEHSSAMRVPPKISSLRRSPERCRSGGKVRSTTAVSTCGELSSIWRRVDGVGGRSVVDEITQPSTWVEFTHDRVTVTRNGRPSAVLISPEELTSLEDTLDLLSDPGAIAQLLQSQSAHVAGDYVTGEELAAKYLNR